MIAKIQRLPVNRLGQSALTVPDTHASIKTVILRAFQASCGMVDALLEVRGDDADGMRKQ